MAFVTSLTYDTYAQTYGVY